LSQNNPESMTTSQHFFGPSTCFMALESFKHGGKVWCSWHKYRRPRLVNGWWMGFQQSNKALKKLGIVDNSDGEYWQYWWIVLLAQMSSEQFVTAHLRCHQHT
jgi:hypothetical protein